MKFDQDVTPEFFPTQEEYVLLFDWLNEHKEIDQKGFLKYPVLGLKKNIDKYRWNYVEDKAYPCNETRSVLKTRLNKQGIFLLSSLIKKQKNRCGIFFTRLKISMI